MVEDKIILEFKAASELLPIHEQQVLSYLKATGIPLGILINFGTSRVQAKRIIQTDKKSVTAHGWHYDLL